MMSLVENESSILLFLQFSAVYIMLQQYTSNIIVLRQLRNSLFFNEYQIATHPVIVIEHFF
jgi:hypothetical protein